MPADPQTSSHQQPHVPPTSGQTKKLVVVGALVLVLIGAIVTQPGEEEKVADDSTTELELSTIEAALPDDHLVAKPLPEFTEVRSLSRIEIAAASQQELFVMDESEIQERPRGETRVQAIYATDGGHAALVGRSIVRSGEPLPDGRTVLQVTPNGIQLCVWNRSGSLATTDKDGYRFIWPQP